MTELRVYLPINDLQPQFAAYLATPLRARGACCQSYIGTPADCLACVEQECGAGAGLGGGGG